MSDTELALLSAASGLVGAALGAVLGAISTYRLTRRLEQERLREATSRLLVLMLSEIYGHVNATAREVDRVLPHWMWRGGDGDLYVAHAVDGAPPVQLATSSFDTHHASLLNADHLLQITFHYDNVRHTNACAATVAAGSGGDAVACVRSCIHTLQSAMGTMEILLDDARVRELLAAYHVSIGDNYTNLASWFRSRVALAGLNFERLQELEQNADPALSAVVGEEWKSLLREATRVRTGP